MKLKEIEKFHQENNVLPNQSSTLRRIKSMNELTPTEEYFFRRIILIICIINSILGYYLLTISFLISLSIYIIYSFFIKKRSKTKIPIDDISLIPYTFTIFIILNIILYFTALPCSIFFLWKMLNNEIYSDARKYKLLYIFIGINSIIGFILFYIIIVMIIKNTTHSVKQIKFDFDVSKLNKLKDEINVAMKNAHKTKIKFE